MKKLALFILMGSLSIFTSACNKNLIKPATSSISDKISIKKVEKPKLKDMGIFNIDKLEDIEIKTPKKEITKDTVTDEMINDHIDAILYNNLITNNDKVIENEDIVSITINAYDGENKIETMDDATADLTVGKTYFYADEIDDSLIGKHKDEDYELNINFPQDYENKVFANKNIKFIIHVNEIKQVPELNDEFVKKYSQEKFQTVDEFKNDIRTNLEKIALMNYNTSLYKSIIRTLFNEKYLQPSKKMIEYEKTLILNQVNKENLDSNTSMEDMLKSFNMDMQQFMAGIDNTAVKNAYYDMLVSYIIDKYKITVNEKTTGDFVNYYNILNGTEFTADDIKKTIGQNQNFDTLVLNKTAFDYIAGKVKIVEVDEEELIPTDINSQASGIKENIQETNPENEQVKK